MLMEHLFQNLRLGKCQLCIKDILVIILHVSELNPVRSKIFLAWLVRATSLLQSQWQYVGSLKP